jgi:hypothetical protein
LLLAIKGSTSFFEKKEAKKLLLTVGCGACIATPHRS